MRLTPPRLRLRRLPRLLLIATLPLLLGACASLSTDRGLGPVQQAARQHLGQDLLPAQDASSQDSIARRVGELLAAELTADSALQIALLNNPGLQAKFQALGLAEAELVQASRLPNPGFSFGRSKKGDEREIERSLSFDLGHLITLPLNRQLEQRRFAAQQLQTSQQMLALAAETRKAFYRAVAAAQTLRYLEQVKEAADAGAEMARRLARAGNLNKLEQAREHGFYAEAVLNLARGQQAELAARERLIRLLGLWGAQTQALKLPERLPELPGAIQEQPEIEQQAFAQRLDVQAAKLQSEQMARNLGLNKITRFVNVLELGLINNSSNEAPKQTGYELSIELPLFDWGDARVARAERLYMQSLHSAAQVAIEARSELREAYLGLRSSYDIARHYRDDIVPTAKRISEENLLRYNGMFISVFELLADSRSQMASVMGAIAAQRDFWTARADLDMALIGKPSLSGPGEAAGTAPAAAPAGH